MQKYLITTDSGCDLPMSLLQSRNIVPLQLFYELNGVTYTDTMLPTDSKAFYDRMRNGAIPKTSQVNLASYLNFWLPLLAKGLPIVHISLGSGISGTYNNSLAAAKILMAENPSSKIFSVDSTLASVGYGMLTLKAADMRDAGETPEDCVRWLESHKAEINTYYTTSDLEYLYRSGRVSRAKAAIATLLDINPILNLDLAGHLLIREKIRGRKATIQRIHVILHALCINPEDQTLYICHSDILDKAQEFGEGLKKDLGFRDVYYTYIGPTIGSHSGPGLMAAFFYGKPRVLYKN